AGQTFDRGSPVGRPSTRFNGRFASRFYHPRASYDDDLPDLSERHDAASGLLPAHSGDDQARSRCPT
ncbi:hypothetical protein, partial [Dactylosporangium roseum]|uniref:hypothetical protein n=1 Tax=Dactylosporangium roseum TaxID=47989 RepID=UPI0031D32332